MKVSLERVGDAIHFEGRNERGDTVTYGTSVQNGGLGVGVSPMQTMLMAMAACSGIDILMILAKGRQVVDGFRAEVEAEREPGAVPSLFTDIRVHYALEGDLDPAKVRRAIELSLGTYCSVSKMLEKTAPISYTFSVNGESYA